MSDRTKELSALEQQLAAMQPAAPAVDRDRLMYQAGWEAAQAIAAKRVMPRVWRAVACLSTAAMLVLVLQLGTLHNDSDSSLLIASKTLSVEENLPPERQAWPTSLITSLDQQEQTESVLSVRKLIITHRDAEHPTRSDDAASILSEPAPATARRIMDELLFNSNIAS